MKKIAIICDTGVDHQKILEKFTAEESDTPYGLPNSKLLKGSAGSGEVILLLRHGEKQDVPSYKVNFKANLYALKKAGCTHIIASSICHSLQEEIEPGEFIIFNQFIDHTKHLDLTFSDTLAPEEMNHNALAFPFTNELRDALIETAVSMGTTVHTKGTVISIDGPRFSTRAESNLYRHWNADVVNMTTAPEAILAHELGIPFADLSLCSSFDSWRTDIKPATRDEKMEVIRNHREKFTDMVLNAVNKLLTQVTTE